MVGSGPQGARRSCDTAVTSAAPEARSGTALNAAGAELAIRYTLRTTARTANAAAAAGAVAATALLVPLTLLAVVLAVDCGSSYPTHAEGSQRAPYEGCSHQLERLAPREISASQAASELVEGALGR
jgi:hypothetical protein